MSCCKSSFVLLALLGVVHTCHAWACIPLQSKQIHEGITWNTQNCSMDESKQPLLTINSIHIALDSTKNRVVPAIADAVHQVQYMAVQYPNLIAGINGGFFWRVDVEGYWRDCQYKDIPV